ncbi:ATP-binding cassette sub-family C member 3 [Halotydeus destructor]|nr:ATP-binding cassette sub-family C member 3 [Halotydeus destructor]
MAASDTVFVYSDFFAPLVKAATFLLLFIFLYYHRIRGVTTSGVVWTFVFFNFLATLPVIYSITAHGQHTDATEKLMQSLYSVLMLLLLISCSVADQASTKEPTKGETAKGSTEDHQRYAANPLYTASFPSRMIFSWFEDLVHRGYKTSLQVKDLYAVADDDRASTLGEQFEKIWLTQGRVSKKVRYSATTAKIESTDTTSARQPGVLVPLIKSFGWSFIIATSIKFFSDCLQFANPQLLKWLIAFIESPTDPLWHGVLIASIMLALPTFQSIVSNAYFKRIIVAGLRNRNCVTAIIYRKALLLSNSSRKGTTVGEIVNLMSVDSQRLFDVMIYINALWTVPVQIFLALYFLWAELGWATLAGVVIMVIIIPLNGYLAGLSKKMQTKQMKEKDERIKAMNEILSGIKVIKLYAWEESFMSLVSGLPMINYSVMAWVSIKRLNKFFSASELEDYVTKNENLEAITIENGSFTWEAAPENSQDDLHVTLKDIDLHVPKGSFLAIVGNVGTGKSSLLSALLGEMDKIQGSVNISGEQDIAYVPQQAWVQNATLRDNILFGKPFDKKKYSSVIKACALKQDIEILPGGDETEIGEKGINLSGGQKQRINLSRACYSDADLYLMDDPLSAVDSHVAKHLFDKVLSSTTGILKSKTRVLVTNNISLLPNVDNIVVLKNGNISETGSYKELMDKDGDFAEFVKQFSTRAADAVEDVTSSNLERQISAKDERAGSIEQPPKASHKLIEVETAETGQVKSSVYIHYIRAVTWPWVIIIFLSLVGSQAAMGGADFWLSLWSTDQPLIVNGTMVQDREKTNTRLIVYGLLGLAQGILLFVTSFSMAKGTLDASVNIHREVLAHILRSPMSFFDTTPLGRIVNRFSRDVDTVDAIIPQSLRGFLDCLLQVFVTIFMIGYATPYFLLLVVPTSLVYYYIQKFYIPTSRQLKRLESITRSPIFSHFSETLSGVSTIRAYKANQRFIDESDKRVDYNQMSVFSRLMANRWLSVRLDLLGNFVILGAAMFAVFSRNSIDSGSAGLSVTYALSVTLTLNMLIRNTSELETNIVSVERLLEYSEIPTEAPFVVEQNRPDENWPARGEVEFDNYGSRYRPGLELVIKNITTVVHSEEKIGIVGRTGAGKSTITLALFRLIEPAEGKIIIDGVDVSKLGLHDLRSKITIIPQDPVLFSGTLRSNLDPFSLKSDEKLWKSLEHAHLKQFVKSLDHGLEHKVAEGGENLSVGQRQLICLARALLRKTKILVLDEATAAVDLETDSLIQSTIRKEFDDCTIFTIAHRLNTILDSTRVMVLDKGEIVEFDNPQELLKKPTSVFYSLAKDAGLV